MFAQDRATLKAGHRKKLDAVAELLTRYPQLKVGIEGYVDKSETKYGLKAMLKRRTKKVADYLESRSISTERMIIVRQGALGSDDEATLRRTRRVVVRVEVP